MYNGIIIAAGMGSRLLPYTKNKPKAMLPIFGKPMISHIYDSFKKNNIENIGIVTGHLHKSFHHFDTKFFFNEDYKNNNILHSLMYAREVFENSLYKNKDLFISYSDIYFKESLLRKLINFSNDDIIIVVDKEWKKLYQSRNDNPLDQGEMVEHDGNKVVKIGKGISKNSNLNRAEFIGLLKLTNTGVRNWLKAFDDLNKRLEKTRPFHLAKEWQKSYLTDFIQELTNRGQKVTICETQNDWLEFDTVGDYERVLKYSTLQEFQLTYSD